MKETNWIFLSPIFITMTKTLQYIFFTASVKSFLFFYEIPTSFQQLSNLQIKVLKTSRIQIKNL